MFFLLCCEFFLVGVRTNPSDWFQLSLKELNPCVPCLPSLLQASLAWHLAILSDQHLAEPLTGFVLSLPEGWGLGLAWGLAALALAPLLLGALVQVAWVRRGVPLNMVSTHQVQPLLEGHN